MKKFFSDITEAPLIELFRPWKSFDKASPLLWVFLASLVLLIIGLNVSFLSLFAWIGGFLIIFFVAVALALFESL